MPVGPSHRRGGGSYRSSSSRSSSSRSSSSRSYSSSRSSSSRSYHRHNHYYYGDDDYYGGGGITITPRGWAIFGIITGLITAIVVMCIAFSMLGNNVPYYYTMKSDAREYAEIIEMARDGVDGYYIISITDIEISGSATEGYEPTEYGLTNYDNFWAEAHSEVTKGGANYYYLDFSFNSEVAEEISGTTYTYYSESQILGLSSLTFAYTKEYDGDGSWDIIQVNYSLSQNVDYWYVKKMITIAAFMIPAALGLVALMVWCSVLVHRAGKKAFGESTQKSTSNQSNNTKSFTDSLFANFGNGNSEDRGSFKVCVYCGAHTKIDASHCTSCGAKKFRKSKDSDLA